MPESIIFKKNNIINSATKAVKSYVNNETSIFVVYFEGEFHAYINQCQHLPVELDWDEAHYFDETEKFLICATHGAVYDPKTGHCLSGPCKSKYLKKLEVIERNHKIEVIYDDSKK